MFIVEFNIIFMGVGFISYPIYFAHNRLIFHCLTTYHQIKENPLKRFYLHFKGI